MDTFDKCPPVSRALIEFLEGVYPDQCPSVSTPDREIWTKVGEVGVVKFLRSIYEEQNAEMRITQR